MKVTKSPTRYGSARETPIVTPSILALNETCSDPVEVVVADVVTSVVDSLVGVVVIGNVVELVVVGTLNVVKSTVVVSATVVVIIVVVVNTVDVREAVPDGAVVVAVKVDCGWEVVGKFVVVLSCPLVVNASQPMSVMIKAVMRNKAILRMETPPARDECLCADKRYSCH